MKRPKSIVSISKIVISGFITVLCFSISVGGQPLPVKTITDADIVGGYFFDSDTIYLFEGYVFAENGEIIEAEPGTILKFVAHPLGSDSTSALVVSKGGIILFEGTRNDPIILTAEADDVSNPDDVSDITAGLWGGLVILGDDSCNSGPFHHPCIPTEDARGDFGGSSADDSSGVLRYVSIRHAGAVGTTLEPFSALTLAGVGSKTAVEYVEVFSCAADAITFLGGTVRAKYLAAIVYGQDGFKINQGYNGAGQYWFTFGYTGRYAINLDGGEDPAVSLPYSIPRFANVTFAGNGIGGTNNPAAINIYDNAGGKWYNSIILEHAQAGVLVENLPSGPDSYERLHDGDLEFDNSIWHRFGHGDYSTAIAPTDSVGYYLFRCPGTNQISDPGICFGCYPPSLGCFDPRPTPGSYTAIASTMVPDDTLVFFDDVPYLGAFDPVQDPIWLFPWSALVDYGSTKLSRDDPPRA